jgi:hypothetical protein
MVSMSTASTTTDMPWYKVPEGTYNTDTPVDKRMCEEETILLTILVPRNTCSTFHNFVFLKGKAG